MYGEWSVGTQTMVNDFGPLRRKGRFWPKREVHINFTTVGFVAILNSINLKDTRH